MTAVKDWKEARAVLDREEERGGRRESRGNFEFVHSELFWESRCFRPFIDEELARTQPELRDRILWPGRADYAVLLSHDVDQLAMWSRLEHWRRLLRPRVPEVDRHERCGVRLPMRTAEPRPRTRFRMTLNSRP